MSTVGIAFLQVGEDVKAAFVVFSSLFKIWI